MKIINNPNIYIGLPGGSFSGLDNFKHDFSNLLIINIEKEGDGLRITTETSDDDQEDIGREDNVLKMPTEKQEDDDSEWSYDKAA